MQPLWSCTRNGGGSITVKVAPSLLAANFSCLSEEVRKVEEAGAEMLHLDVMDGHLVPNISFGVCVIESLRKISKMQFDAHLMIENPEKYVQAFREAGADYIVFHIEAAKEPKPLLKQIRDLGAKAGIAVDAQTSVSEILPYLSDADLALVMSVKAGFAGQKFMPECLEKVRAVKEAKDREHLDLEIQIDGGINPENAKLAVEAGAEILVAGSAVFRAEDPAKAVRQIKGLE